MTLLMSNYAKLYWLTSLDNISSLLCFMMVGSAILAFIYFLVSILWDSSETEEEDEKVKANAEKKFPIFIYLFLVFLFLNTFVPSTKQAIIIISGGKAMDFIQSDTSINKIPGDVTKAINYLLQKEINTLNRDNNKNSKP